MTGSRVSANAAESSGGGIWNSGGSVTATDSTVNANSSGSGGGIDNRGVASQVSLIRSRVTGNAATYDAGGISNARGTVTMTASTVSANTSQASGGGIHNRDGGTIMLDATSSVTGNVPDDCVGTPAC